MTVINKLIKTYHEVMYKYNFVMYSDCLDEGLRVKYLNKVNSHYGKIQ